MPEKRTEAWPATGRIVCQPSLSEPESGARQGPPSGTDPTSLAACCHPATYFGCYSTAAVQSSTQLSCCISIKQPNGGFTRCQHTHGWQGASTLYILYVQQTAAIVSGGRHAKLANGSPECAAPRTTTGPRVWPANSQSATRSRVALPQPSLVLRCCS